MGEWEYSRLEMGRDLWNQFIRAKAQGDSTGIQMSRCPVTCTLSDNPSEKPNAFSCV